MSESTWDDDDRCWRCHGEGGFHDCGEDCCACLDKDEITHVCEECGGSGDAVHERRTGGEE